MPRPKPPEPITIRYIKMSDRQWIMFNELGGADWLRKLVEKKAPMPKQYYDKLLQEEQNDRTRKTTGTIPHCQ